MFGQRLHVLQATCPHPCPRLRTNPAEAQAARSPCHHSLLIRLQRYCASSAREGHRKPDRHGLKTQKVRTDADTRAQTPSRTDGLRTKHQSRAHRERNVRMPKSKHAWYHSPASRAAPLGADVAMRRKTCAPLLNSTQPSLRSRIIERQSPSMHTA